jgi:hypothetical protein
LVGKPEGKRQLGIPRRRWEDNIEVDREILAQLLNWRLLKKSSDPLIILEILLWLKNYRRKKLSSKAVYWKGHFIS